MNDLMLNATFYGASQGKQRSPGTPRSHIIDIKPANNI